MYSDKDLFASLNKCLFLGKYHFEFFGKMIFIQPKEKLSLREWENPVSPRLFLYQNIDKP